MKPFVLLFFSIGIVSAADTVEFNRDIRPITDRNSLFQGLLIGASVLLGLRGCRQEFAFSRVAYRRVGPAGIEGVQGEKG